MATPIYVNKVIGIAASSNYIAVISSGATTSTTFNSSLMPLDTQRRIVFSSSAADTSSLKLTVVGTRQGGGALTEVVTGSTQGAGVNATTLSDFLTVTSVTPSSAPNINIVVGISSVAGTPWVPCNHWVTPVNLTAGVTLNSSAASGNWEFTLDDPTRTTPNPNILIPPVFASTGINAAVGSSGSIGSSATLTTGNIAFPISAWRFTLTSSSSLYSLNATVLQAGGL